MKPHGKEKPEILTSNDVVKALRKERPKILGKLSEKKAAVLINAAFSQVARRIGNLKEGAVRVPKFGHFQVRQITREKDGQKIAVARTVFRAAKPRAKGTQAAYGKS